MPWTGQDPPAIDAILQLIMPCSGGRMPARLGIDKLTGGMYRATLGPAFIWPPTGHMVYSLGPSEVIEEILRMTEERDAATAA